MRVIVTGSRGWADRAAVAHALGPAGLRLDHRDVLVHGACPSGGDRLADDWARTHGVPVERHPAKWEVDGVLDRSAGFKRNAEMANAGADSCLAFWDGKSNGTKHMMEMAHKCGIPTATSDVLRGVLERWVRFEHGLDPRFRLLDLISGDGRSPRYGGQLCPACASLDGHFSPCRGKLSFQLNIGAHVAVAMRVLSWGAP